LAHHLTARRGHRSRLPTRPRSPGTVPTRRRRKMTGRPKTHNRGRRNLKLPPKRRPLKTSLGRRPKRLRLTLLRPTARLQQTRRRLKSPPPPKILPGLKPLPTRTLHPPKPTRPSKLRKAKRPPRES